MTKPVHDVTPIRSIRLKCVECMGGDPCTRVNSRSPISTFIEECVSVTCPLWKFRLGKNPVLTGTRKPVVKQETNVLRYGFINDNWPDEQSRVEQ